MTPFTDDEPLVAELRALGGLVRDPAPAATAAMADAVLARLPRAAVAAGRPARRAGRVADAVRLVLAGRRRRAVALVVVLLLALVGAPPVRASVAEWFGFGGVRVRIDPRPQPSGAPPPPTVSAGTSLAGAAAAVGFAPLVPEELGPPDAVEVSAGRRLVSMSWSDGADGTLRLDQFAAPLDGLFAKTAPGAQYTTVGDAFALWFDGPHEVLLLEPDGTTRTQPPRLAGRTLVWQTAALTLRLEGDLPLGRARQIAASAVPAG
jgi:hypothetical protein